VLQQTSERVRVFERVSGSGREAEKGNITEKCQHRNEGEHQHSIATVDPNRMDNPVDWNGAK
ncbi:hypothetical protein PRIPAC_92965, partial [Pristionchus pacificus]|uniref:Uncharacterized protein n=1 Tax=Pristionchus pacificus TaxID=54126 RepID=A0A2A6BIH7_PRIPA